MTPRNDAQLELELAIRQALDSIELRLDSQDKTIGALNKRIWLLERLLAKIGANTEANDHEIN